MFLAGDSSCRNPVKQITYDSFRTFDFGCGYGGWDKQEERDL